MQVLLKLKEETTPEQRQAILDGLGVSMLVSFVHFLSPVPWDSLSNVDVL